jgi:hypothetical protein
VALGGHASHSAVLKRAMSSLVLTALITDVDVDVDVALKETGMGAEPRREQIVLPGGRGPLLARGAAGDAADTAARARYVSASESQAPDAEPTSWCAPFFRWPSMGSVARRHNTLCPALLLSDLICISCCTPSADALLTVCEVKRSSLPPARALATGPLTCRNLHLSRPGRSTNLCPVLSYRKSTARTRRTYRKKIYYEYEATTKSPKAVDSNSTQGLTIKRE